MATEADARQARGDAGPLNGVPVAIKDNFDVKGAVTTNGRPCGTVADNDAAVVTLLREAGAVLLGKTNLHECAFGPTTDNAHFGPTMNPHRLGFTPGGSSGGSAAAVAAGFCAAALGTDTMGSVRIPASYCGVVGFKPTYGAIGMRGVVPLARRFDHVGTFTRRVRDAVVLVEALTEHDAWADPHHADAGGDDTGGMPLLVGVIDNHLVPGMQDDVRSAFNRAVEMLRAIVPRVTTVVIPGYNPGLARRAGFVCVEVEAAVVHDLEFRRAPQSFSAEIAALLEFGRSVTAPQLDKAQRRVDLAAAGLRDALTKVDVLISPTTPQTAFSFAEPVPSDVADLTAVANFAGCPAISIPMGIDSAGLPIGLQIIGRAWEDAKVLSLAAAYEAAVAS
jgi:aspartyl-tRNA(Asn)/glutamyl-tRNA(Gln) amidotransferase subunit A